MMAKMLILEFSVAAKFGIDSLQVDTSLVQSS